MNDGGVLQAADDLLGAARNFEQAEERRRQMLADPFGVGVKVESDIPGERGVVEIRCDVDYPRWPVGVRWEDGSFDLCSPMELRVSA